MKKLFTILLLSGLSLALLNGCKNPAEDVHIQVSTDIFKSPTVLVFKNVNPAGTPLTNVSVEFIGPQANLIRTVTGGTNFKVTNGYIPVVLDRSANPSTGSPVKFTVLVSAAGFAPTYQDIYITDPKATNQYVITLNEFAKPLPGTAASVTNHAITAGKVGATIQLSTSTGPLVNERVFVTIPAGTSLLDKDKKVINAAQLEARILYSSSVNGVSPKLNGGYLSTHVLNSEGTKLAYGKMVTPDATATIKLTAGSTEVKFFSNPITIEYEINSALINQATNLPYVVGDIVEMHSIDHATGTWKEEGTTTIERGDSGKLVAKKQIDHLSDIFSSSRLKVNGPIIPIPVPYITIPIAIATSAVQSEPYESSIDGRLNIDIKRDKADFDETFTATDDNGPVVFFELKKGELSKTFQINYNYLINSEVSVSSNSYRFKSNEVKVRPAKGSDITITASFETQTATSISASGMLYYKCANKLIISPLNAHVMMVDVKTNQSSIIEIKNGEFAATLIEGNQYKIIVEIDGTPHTYTFTASRTDRDLPTQSGFAFSLRTATTSSGDVSISMTGIVSGPCK